MCVCVLLRRRKKCARSTEPWSEERRRGLGARYPTRTTGGGLGRGVEGCSARERVRRVRRVRRSGGMLGEGVRE